MRDGWHASNPRFCLAAALADATISHLMCESHQHKRTNQSLERYRLGQGSPQVWCRVSNSQIASTSHPDITINKSNRFKLTPNYIKGSASDIIRFLHALTPSSPQQIDKRRYSSAPNQPDNSFDADAAHTMCLTFNYHQLIPP